MKLGQLELLTPTFQPFCALSRILLGKKCVLAFKIGPQWTFCLIAFYNFMKL